MVTKSLYQVLEGTLHYNLIILLKSTKDPLRLSTPFPPPRAPTVVSGQDLALSIAVKTSPLKMDSSVKTGPSVKSGSSVNMTEVAVAGGLLIGIARANFA